MFRRGGLVNFKDEIGFGMCKPVGHLFLEEGGGGHEAASGMMAPMSNMLVACL